MQFLHKDAEHEEKQMLREKLKEKSISVVKEWEKLMQVRKYIAWSYFERRIQILKHI